ncbi:MAG: hypothetical protein WAR79_18035 [Melioribacteraceae bacterium]
MNAPKEIIHAIESILGILFSDVKHKERAIFILCDNAVELCCKTKIREKFPRDNKRKNFYDSLNENNINGELFNEFDKRHNIRDEMQHEKLNITVGFAQCTDFIIDLIKLVKLLWGENSLISLDEWVVGSLKLTYLYSTHGGDKRVKYFENCVFSQLDWREIDSELISITGNGESDETIQIDEFKYIKPKLRKRLPEKYELILPVNKKESLGILIREFSQILNNVLDELNLEFKI